MADIDYAAGEGFVVELVGAAIEVQVGFGQVAFVDDPCHGYLNAFAWFQGWDVVSAVAVVVGYAIVFHFAGSGGAVPGGAIVAVSGFFLRYIGFIGAAIAVKLHQGTDVEDVVYFLVGGVGVSDSGVNQFLLFGFCFYDFIQSVYAVSFFDVGDGVFFQFSV